MPVVATAAVQSLDAWLEEQWKELQWGGAANNPETRFLLPTPTALLLWERVIVEDAAGGSHGGLPDDFATELLDLPRLSRLADDAWGRLYDFGEPDPDEWGRTPETEAFNRWRAAFADYLKAENWLTHAQLTGEITEAFTNNRLARPDALTFRGFERSTPALEKLADALQAAGCDVSRGWLAELTGPSPATAVAYPTAADEARVVAGKVRGLLDDEPNCSIAIITPNLSSARSLYERVLAEELAPASALLDELDSPRRFDMAGAPALSDYALVARALDWLTLKPHGNAFSLVSRLLLSPYPRPAALLTGNNGNDIKDWQSEQEARARCEANLRGRNAWTASLDYLATRLKKSGAGATAGGIKRLAKLLEDDEAASPVEWAQRFAARLHAVSWPGGGLSATEGVAFARWRDVLAQLTAMTTVAPSMTRAQALDHTRRLADDTPSQAASSGLQVQVLGVLDAAGLEFDHAFLVGFDAGSFPASASPHPLLPAHWQAETSQPRSSPEVELDFARRVWKRLLGSAKNVHASCARQGDGDQPLQPCSMLGEQAAAPTVDHKTWYRPSDSSKRQEQLVPREPDSAPPALVLSGGTNLLKDQSECPFRALASRRLHVGALEEPAPGITPADRGTLVHNVLEKAWDELGDSATLKEKTNDQLRQLVENKADEVLAESPGLAVSGLLPAARSWLVEISSAWLHFEKFERRDKWTVVATEAGASITFDGVELGPMSIDRVDRLVPSQDGKFSTLGGVKLDPELADGGDGHLGENLAIIDYKTASTKSGIGKWMGDRPREPQLPLYALALEKNGTTGGEVAAGAKVATIAFGNLLSSAELSFSSPPDFRLDGTQIVKRANWPGWKEAVSGWRTTLTRLARDYKNGVVDVDPVKQDACTWCDRQSLCRVFELPGALEAAYLAEESEEEEG
jgi:probable DNA repair protein